MRCHLLTTLILLIAPILLIFLPPVLATPIDRTSTSVSFATAALESSRDALLPEVNNEVDEVVGSTEEDEEVRDEIAVTDSTSVEVEDEEQGKEEGDNDFLESPFTSSDEEGEEDERVDQMENSEEQSDTGFTNDDNTQDARADDTVVLKPRQEEASFTFASS
jgi:hypothetical protein